MCDSFFLLYAINSYYTFTKPHCEWHRHSCRSEQRHRRDRQKLLTVKMIYTTHIRNNLSTCCPGEFTAKELEQIKSQNLMKLPAASVDGALQPQAVTFAYQVDSSSDSTRRLMLTRLGSLQWWKCGQWPKKTSQICKGESLWSEIHSFQARRLSAKTCSIFLLDKSVSWNLPQEMQMSDVSLSITGRERQRLAGYDQHVCLSVQNSSATHNVLIWRDAQSLNCYRNQKQLEKFQMFFSG